MNFAKRLLLSGVIGWGVTMGSLACSGGQPAPSPEPVVSPTLIVASPTPEEQDVVTVKYPSLYLSANSATVLLDKVKGGFQIYTLPDLTPRWSADSYENIVDVILSPSGNQAALWTTADNALELLGREPEQSYALPYRRARIQGLTLADSGDRMVLLAAPDTGQAQSRLEIWSLPPGDKPVAAIELPVANSGRVLANGEFSRFAVRFGNDKFTAVYDWAKQDEPLTLLWQETDPNHSPTDLALYHDWVWAVQDEGPLGWFGTDEPVQLPGNLRDRLRFSPTGSHLLVYRVEKSIDVTTAEVLFRLFDLNSLHQTKQVSHVINNHNNAVFGLSADLELFELRATRAATLEFRELGW